MRQTFVILGAGGFAREVLDIFDACNETGREYEVLGFVVEPGHGQPGTPVNGKPILGDFGWLADHLHDVRVVCGVGSPALRRRLVTQGQQIGVRFSNIIHPTAVLTRHVSLGEGVVITAGCIFTNRIRVGNHVHINLNCTIGHDAVLEDFSTLAPGVHVSGDVLLEEGCYIGTGVNIIGKKTIGAWSVVGAGTAVIADVPSNTIVVGVPGKVIKAREIGWQLNETHQMT